MKSFGQRASGERLERMRGSPRWAGNGFRNLAPIAAGLRDAGTPMPSISEMLRPRPPRVPGAPLPLTDLHRRGVAVVHGLIYAVIFGIGASGALTGARSAWPEYLRGELAQAPALGAMASREVHEALVFMLVGLVLLHVAGMALQHVRRGGVLQRIVPFRK